MHIYIYISGIIYSTSHLIPVPTTKPTGMYIKVGANLLPSSRRETGLYIYVYNVHVYMLHQNNTNTSHRETNLYYLIYYCDCLFWKVL